MTESGKTITRMMRWTSEDGDTLYTPGSQVVSEASGESFEAHSADAGKHHTHANAVLLEKLAVDADGGLKVDGVGVGGIAIVASPDETPVYNGKLRVVLTEYVASGTEPSGS